MRRAGFLRRRQGEVRIQNSGIERIASACQGPINCQSPPVQGKIGAVFRPQNRGRERSWFSFPRWQRGASNERRSGEGRAKWQAAVRGSSSVKNCCSEAPARVLRLRCSHVGGGGQLLFLSALSVLGEACLCLASVLREASCVSRRCRRSLESSPCRLDPRGCRAFQRLVPP